MTVIQTVAGGGSGGSSVTTVDLRSVSIPVTSWTQVSTAKHALALTTSAGFDHVDRVDDMEFLMLAPSAKLIYDPNNNLDIYQATISASVLEQWLSTYLYGLPDGMYTIILNNMGVLLEGSNYDDRNMATLLLTVSGGSYSVNGATTLYNTSDSGSSHWILDISKVNV